jgi:hypothetical protein
LANFFITFYEFTAVLSSALKLISNTGRFRGKAWKNPAHMKIKLADFEILNYNKTNFGFFI